MNLIKNNLKSIINANFVFMAFVVLFLGIIFTYTSNISQFSYTFKAINKYNSFMFLFIVFAGEISKSLMQKDKINRKIEWFLSNNVSKFKIIYIYSISNYFATLLLLMPSIVVTGIYYKNFEFLFFIEYCIYSFICCIMMFGQVLIE